MIKIECEDKFEMWQNFLKIASQNAQQPLTKREIDILAFALAQPITIQNPLRGNSRKQLKQVLKMSEQNLSMHRGSLVEKGWVEHDTSMLNKNLQSVRENFEKSFGKKLLLHFEISLR